MYSSSELLKMVNNTIDSLPYDRKPAALYDPIRYVLSLGGKRLRPVLMLMAYNMYKDDVQNILMPAIAIETYHNFTLLHDDLMDRAEVRRGKPCVHKKWNDNAAILSGDNMLVLAFHRMIQCNEKYMPTVLRLFTETALEIDEGQQYDIDFEDRSDVTEAEYIEMIRLKTSVLLACALKIGAVLGGASEQDADALYEFGEKLGLAFQLQDDYLDVYGDFKTFGKQIGGDIMCNKKTYMLINAQLLANKEQAQELNMWLNKENPVREEKVAAVTRLYDEIGVPQLVRDKINQYYQEAAQAIARVSLPQERTAILWDYAQSMLNRKS
ncbi:MAG: polyprenyl synthetase family protein [Bacteroidaceae bacterium]|nr:polyprenyl synthetase family protein [Bacteroidaceae bacterium]